MEKMDHYTTLEVMIQGPKRWLLESNAEQFRELCITGLALRARDIFNGERDSHSPVFLNFNGVRAKVHGMVNGYWIRRIDLDFNEILNEDNYTGFRLFFQIPNEWVNNCFDLQKLTDFLTLAAGVRRYGLFSPSSSMEDDEYFLEHLNVVVEVLEIQDFVFLLKKRPDIDNLSGDEFDFDIIEGPVSNPAETEEFTMSQMDIDFHPTQGVKIEEIVVIDEENEEEERQREVNEATSLLEVIIKQEPQEPDDEETHY
ncbi:uncharacterized protein LOC127286378 [Leptopilina boulardi]|uniref:uncharacterized protein LOC127279887 n=1 Tax=Leptopilina boulardi TaxID=63433 RepID=UPI0021F5103C|nr:uncharacterized protein LOC127279887 [Leptopilina boulardi]XP_051168734.1 uncharacterized protein LOC127286378 [Leptopilina boulardi]